MAISNVKSLKQIRGIRQAIIDIPGPSSYVAGGQDVSPTALTSYSAISAVVYLLIPVILGDDTTYYAQWDQANDKLVWFVTATDAEVTGTTDIDAFTVRALVIGS